MSEGGGRGGGGAELPARGWPAATGSSERRGGKGAHTANRLGSCPDKTLRSIHALCVDIHARNDIVGCLRSSKLAQTRVPQPPRRRKPHKTRHLKTDLRAIPTATRPSLFHFPFPFSLLSIKHKLGSTSLPLTVSSDAPRMHQTSSNTTTTTTPSPRKCCCWLKTAHPRMKGCSS